MTAHFTPASLILTTDGPDSCELTAYFNPAS